MCGCVGSVSVEVGVYNVPCPFFGQRQGVFCSLSRLIPTPVDGCEYRVWITVMGDFLPWTQKEVGEIDR